MSRGLEGQASWQHQRKRPEAHARTLRSVVVVLSATGIYLLVFAPIYGLAGLGAGGSWVCDYLRGLAAGAARGGVAVVLAFVLNAYCITSWAYSGWDVDFSCGWRPGCWWRCYGACAAGWVRDLVARLRAQSRELVREREALREQGDPPAHADRAIARDYLVDRQRQSVYLFAVLAWRA